MVKLPELHKDCKYTKQTRMRLVHILRELYPGESRISKLGRKCRPLVLISEDIGRRIYLPMGRLGYIFEMEQQLIQHKYMIHPYSTFYHYWKIFALIEFTLSFFLRLLYNAHWVGDFHALMYQLPALVSDLIETTDILLRILIGYVDKDNQCIIMEFRKVLYRNLYDIRFYVDLLVSLPLDFIVFMSSRLSGNVFPSVYSYASYLKLLKIISLTGYINDLSKVYNWNEVCLHLVFFAFLTFHLAHWLSCVLALGQHLIDAPLSASAGVLKDEPKLTHHLKCLYIVLNTFFGQSSYFTRSVFDTETGSNIVWFIFINFINFFYIFFLSLFIQFLALMKTSQLFYAGLSQEIQKILAQENLPRQVHKKVLKYLKFCYNCKYFDENAILETLSPPLKREVKNFLCYDLIINSESIFNCLPDDLATKLCLRMKLRIYIAGDTIFRAGQKSSSIYFLYSGSVVIYSARGQELTHWYKGQQFGVASFLESRLYLLTAVALETSEIYILRHSDFVEETKDNHELFQTVHKAARTRVDLLLKEFSQLPGPH